MSAMVFSVEDIHRLREAHYEASKDMTPEEIIAATNRNAQEALRIMAEKLAQADSATLPLEETHEADT